MCEKVELVEEIKDSNSRLIEAAKLDGDNLYYLKEYLDSEVGESVRENVFKNAFKSMVYFANPFFNSPENDFNLSKILAIGRVQSGKTSFFISTIALAFDNGYDLVYLIGGTKNTLRDQNYERVDEYFENNPDVIVYDINKANAKTVLKKISIGYKIILVVLKNAAESANLGRAIDIASECFSIPSLVVDDEGDEYTPGAPKLFSRTGTIGKTHDAIANLIYSLKNCTFLSVTATPQANFLISTIDSVSPDYCVLVEPGIGYTGGNAFHDTLDNPHVSEILDADDFKESIPESFMDSLFFFIFAVALKRTLGDKKPYSMLVHPSSYTKVQNAVVDKIKDRLENIVSVLSDENNAAYSGMVDLVLKQSGTYFTMNPESTVSVDLSKVKNELFYVATELTTFEFNVSSSGREDIEKEKKDKSLYKIYVGGNMLGRGLTIKNLAVTYMYRDSKIQAIDTLYQRARWLGYKSSYFDICRVYMTDQLKQKFVSTVESENDMWDSLINFLSIDNDIKNFNRIFTLNDESGKLILTRKTVSKTVTVERVNPGFTYDKSVWFTEEAKQQNLCIYKNYRELHQSNSYEQCFSTNDYQTHLIINTKFSAFFDEFLKQYRFPRGSKFGLRGFERILEQVERTEISDELVVMVMRYKTNEYRSLVCDGALTIKELPQSYNRNTGYDGDKNLPGFTNKMHFQIHLVYTDENKPEDIVILLCFCNPLSQQSIRFMKFVTGDNSYGSI